MALRFVQGIKDRRTHLSGNLLLAAHPGRHYQDQEYQCYHKPES
jgi:hypothetical protein